MDDEKRQARRERRSRRLAALGRYLDDLLLLGGGMCFVGAAALQFGFAAALTAAGSCLVIYAWIVARAGRKR